MKFWTVALFGAVLAAPIEEEQASTSFPETSSVTETHISDEVGLGDEKILADVLGDSPGTEAATETAGSEAVLREVVEDDETPPVVDTIIDPTTTQAIDDLVALATTTLAPEGIEITETEIISTTGEDLSISAGDAAASD